MSSQGQQRNLFKGNWRYLSLLVLCAAGFFRSAPCQAQHMLGAAPAVEATSPASAVRPPPSTIVIGFMGGMVKRNESSRSEVQLARKLREQYPSLAYVDTYENAHWKDALEKIL